jgi:hypothetical protein
LVKGNYSAYPFATIQAAVDSLPKKILNTNAVRINVGAGTFPGFAVEGFSCGARSAVLGLYNGPFNIIGTRATATPATGPATGTANAPFANTSLTLTGAGWTTNDLVGRYLRVTAGTGAGSLVLIASNTADYMRFAGQASTTLDGTSQFVIEDLVTIINTVPAGRSAGITANNNTGDSVRFYDLKTTNTGSYGIRAANSSNITMYRCVSSGACNLSIAIVSIPGTTVLQFCGAFNGISNGFYIQSCNYVGSGGGAITARNTPIGLNLYDVVDYAIAAGGGFYSCSTAAVQAVRATLNLGGGIRFDACAVGVWLDESSLTLLPGTIDFSNGGTFTKMLKNSKMWCFRDISNINGPNTGWGFDLSGSNNVVQLSFATPTIVGALGAITVDGYTDETWAVLANPGDYVIDQTTGSRIYRIP